MTFRFGLWLMATVFLSVTGFSAVPKTLTMSLKQAESKALAFSNSLKAARSDWSAADYQAQSQQANLYPRLTLDGSYRYQGVVPSINIAPGETFPFGAYNNYTIGPTLTYTIWNGGATLDLYKSLQALTESRKANHRFTAQQILMNARLAYVKVQLAIEELHLIAGTLRVAQAQYSDISKRFLAGSASRLDRLQSHRDMLGYLLQFKQRQADLGSNIEDLLNMTGDQDQLMPGETLAPSDEAVLRSGATQLPPATLMVHFDPLLESLKNIVSLPDSEPGPDHPELKAQEFQALSSTLSAQSAKGLLWPSLQLSARSSLDYPNGPLLEQIYQNTVALTMSLPLWEWDRTRDTVSQRLSEAESAEYRRKQTELDLHRDWRKALDQIEALQSQLEISRQAAQEAQEHAKLSYQTYKYGRISLLDVQNSNLRALEAQVQSARIVAQILVQKIQLLSLSGKEFSHE